MNEPDADKVDALGAAVEDLCHLHDHITRVIANLDIDEDWFEDYDDSARAKFALGAVVKTLIYMHARGFSQSATARRLNGAAYVYVRFGLDQPLDQQAISYTLRNRFTREERQLIESIGQRVREVCHEHDVVDRGEPALDPDDVDAANGIGEADIREAVERATDLCFEEFIDPRGPSITYDLQAYFERQGYLNLAKAGTTTPRRRFARLSDRSEVPAGSSHNRTMKKVADPDRQSALRDFADRHGPDDWRRIRDAVLPAFHRGVENQLDEIGERDSTGIREPVNVAIDITYWLFWSSLFRDEENVDFVEEPVTIDYKDGSTREVYPKEDYPEMVSGLKDSHRCGYKFATITTIAEDTPIILGIEPVRDRRGWDLETRTRGELVDRLLEQAEQHVDINKVYADREFDSYEVRHVIDQRDNFYVIRKRNQANAEQVAIEKTIEHDEADLSVEQGTLTYEGETHDISFIYVPKNTEKDKEEYIEGDYAIFTTNAHVEPDEGWGIAETYRDRWMIENQYKSINENFLPKTATTDFRNRFLMFVIGAVMYNVWRMTNFILRDNVDVDLGESPPIPAGEIVELVGTCLFDPGD